MTTGTTLASAISLQPFVLDRHRIMVGDLVVDLPLRTIHSRSLRTVKLTGNEFALLATLIKSTGQFVSRRELLTAVAGSGAVERNDAIIDVYIRYLIRRLTEAESAATIDKATDVGYRLLP